MKKILITIVKSPSLKAAWAKAFGLQNPKSFLGEKTLLCSEPEESNLIRYRCAIAFPLAHILGITPEVAAEQILALLADNQDWVAQPDQSEKLDFRIAVTASTGGWLDFDFCNHEITQLGCDRNLLIWLEILRQEDFSAFNLKIDQDKDPLQEDLFPFWYIRERCATLLALAEREGLIVLVKSGSTWEITSLLGESHGKNTLHLLSSAARKMLWQICHLCDLIVSEQTLEPRKLRQLKQQISSAWLDYVAHCNFCGAIAQEKPEIAISRLRIIAVVFQLMYAILLA